MMEAEEVHTEAINVDNKDISDRETNAGEIIEIMAEATHSDSGLMAEEFHSEVININNHDRSEIGLIDEDYLMSFFTKTGDCDFILWLNSEILVFKKGVLKLIILTEKLL